jgi:hypothetical protein
MCVAAGRGLKGKHFRPAFVFKLNPDESSVEATAS